MTWRHPPSQGLFPRDKALRTRMTSRHMKTINLIDPWITRTYFGSLDTFFTALPSWTCFAADPNWSVLTDSERLLEAGLTLTKTHAFPSPPSELCNKWVSLEFLYGTCIAFVFRAVKTWPSAVKDLFIAAASTSLCPVASVLEIRSDPARSTSVKAPCVTAREMWSVPWTRRISRRWERELLVFILVVPTERLASPGASKCKTTNKQTNKQTTTTTTTNKQS